jgi:hypothetical protein
MPERRDGVVIPDLKGLVPALLGIGFLAGALVVGLVALIA